jgi:imidazolonepropionase-like amidohydrolase
LLTRLLRVQNERLNTLAQRLARPLPGVTLIREVRWFDAPAARPRGPADICLFDGRIAAILPAGTGPADAAQSIDGRGRTLLPGLFDANGHLSRTSARRAWCSRAAWQTRRRTSTKRWGSGRLRRRGRSSRAPRSSGSAARGGRYCSRSGAA